MAKQTNSRGKRKYKPRKTDSRKVNKAEEFFKTGLKYGLPQGSSVIEHYEDPRVMNKLDDNDIEVSVSHYGCTYQPDLPYVEGLISQIINKMEVRNSYSSNLTYTKLKNYLRDAFKTLSVFFAGYTSQNMKQLKDDNARDLSNMFNHIGQIAEYSTDDYASDTTVTTGVFGEENISNAVWVQKFLARLQVIRIPKPLIEVAAYLYLGAFKITDDSMNVQKYVRFWPKYTIDSKDLLVTTNADFHDPDANDDIMTVAFDHLDSYFTTDGDLTVLLDYLGWKSDDVINLELKRDLTANQAMIKADPHLRLMLDNAYVNLYSDLTITDSRDAEVVRVNGVNRNLKVLGTDIQVKSLDIKRMLFLRDKLIYLHVAVLRHSGTTSFYHLSPVGHINIDNFTTLDAQNKAAVENLSYVITNSALYGVVPKSEYIDYIFADDGTLSSITVTETNDPMLCTNIYLSDASTYSNEYNLELAFGVEWRKNLQLALNRIPERPNNKG